MLQFSSSQFSNLRWRYFVESLLLKSTPNVSSVVLSSARVAGVDRADARASSVAREPPRFFGETAALRVAGFLAAGLAAGFLAGAALTAGFFGDGFLHRGGVSRLVASRGRRVSDRYRREICNYVRRSVAPSQSPLKFTKTLCPKNSRNRGEKGRTRLND